MGCPAPAGLSGSLPSGPEAANAKLLRMGLSSLLVLTVIGACSPMLPSLPSSGMLLAKPLFADACTHLTRLQLMLARGLHVCVCKVQGDSRLQSFGILKAYPLKGMAAKKPLLIHAVSAITYSDILHIIQEDALAQQLHVRSILGLCWSQEEREESPMAARELPESDPARRVGSST